MCSSSLVYVDRLTNPSVWSGEALTSRHTSVDHRRLHLLVDGLLCSISIQQGICSICIGLQLLRLPFLGRVCALVEAREQKVEHDGVGANEVGEGNRVVAVVLEEQLEGMDHDEYELDLRKERQEIIIINCTI